jgi:hypothetical protein
MSNKKKKVERCVVCGAKATHKKLSTPMCDNPVCEVVRQESIEEELKKGVEQCHE